ncbi:hypothetical protein FOCG_18453 [Fusarium oxysporum f. sp. radicis-lycopersici 26381]|nr:hypothetical protein FOCG_18453 [Fusarium oxysporum f. sp. radicis-lycopersici 26381]
MRLCFTSLGPSPVSAAVVFRTLSTSSSRISSLLSREERFKELLEAPLDWVM